MRQTIKDLFGDLGPWGRLWLNFGVAALIAASWMSFMVGLKMTFAHAMFLVILSVAAAFLPVTAEFMWQQGRRLIAGVLGLLTIPLLVVEFGQHAAYTAGIRGHEMAVTRVQNRKYDGAQDNVAELRGQIAFWTKRRESLIAQNGWTASVTADALRAKLASLNLAIDQEAARGGCKQRCLARTQERDEAASRIAVLEETSGLDDRIKLATGKLEQLRTAAATVEHKSSQTEHMNAFLSKAVAFVGQGELQPNAHVEEGTQLSANLAMALAATGLPALCFFAAGLFRRRRSEDDDAPAHVARETVNTPAPTQAAQILLPRSTNVRVGRAVFPQAA